MGKKIRKKWKNVGEGVAGGENKVAETIPDAILGLETCFLLAPRGFFADFGAKPVFFGCFWRIFAISKGPPHVFRKTGPLRKTASRCQPQLGRVPRKGPNIHPFPKAGTTLYPLGPIS